MARGGVKAAGAAQRPIVEADSVTQLGAGAHGSVVLCGSHGGRFSASCALAAGVAGIVLNDAAVGRDRAGIAGLLLLDEHGVPGATVDRSRSVIGKATETGAGTLSHVNASAAELGLAAGMAASAFVERVRAAGERPMADRALPQVAESRSLLVDRPMRVWAIDSASLARPQDAGAILVTGSHVQLVGGEPASALRADARIAVFNDAGGVMAPSRLEALDERGIAAVAVKASSARIGDARSHYFDGVISAVNTTAAADGAAVLTTVQAYVTSVVERTMDEGIG